MAPVGVGKSNRLQKLQAEPEHRIRTKHQPHWEADLQTRHWDEHQSPPCCPRDLTSSRWCGPRTLIKMWKKANGRGKNCTSLHQTGCSFHPQGVGFPAQTGVGGGEEKGKDYCNLKLSSNGPSMWKSKFQQNSLSRNSVFLRLSLPVSRKEGPGEDMTI